ncbi:hypothetical protein PR048_030970 [Dryococelus australis]|uniref:Uncharacterized protein n=1 Tax=Dryococelus australis TaxID=614101 RepID=A0ABQ9GAD4_9NEOP|nr:hypothetical protein PR048_030970 [Dryococelus australis]
MESLDPDTAKFISSVDIKEADRLTAVMADFSKDEYIRDVFIDRLQPHYNRQRLLENLTLSLEEVLSELGHLNWLNTILRYIYLLLLSMRSLFETSGRANNCSHLHYFFFGVDRGTIGLSDTEGRNLQRMRKKGYFLNICRNSKSARDSSSSTQFSNCVASLPACLKTAIVDVTINGYKAYGLIDTGSNTNRKLKLVTVLTCDREVSMASTSLRSSLVFFLNLCSDIIVGHNILKRHSSLRITFGVWQLLMLNRHSYSFACLPTSDLQVIGSEIQNLLKVGIIEKSVSPWCARVMVLTSENHRRRIAVDYSQTINRYAELDAFPLPRIDHII